MITMKEMTILPRIFEPKRKLRVAERRGQERKDFSYWMQVVDNSNEEILGHLIDISHEGFRLQSQNPIPLKKDFRFGMEVPPDLADQPSIVFIARSKWCQIDPYDPAVYNVGFQLINISYGCYEIFKRMMEKYGMTYGDTPVKL